MRNKILSLLLAVCLVAALLPVVSMAAPQSASLVMRSNDENLSLFVERGGATVYALTTEKGIVTTNGATAKNYHIKFAYPVRGKPTLYLKNANIVNKTGHGISVPATTEAFSLDLVVEANSTITAAHSGIVFNNGDLTVKGKAALEITAAGTGISVNSVTAVGNFIMDGAQLDINAGSDFAAVQVMGGDARVKGGAIAPISQRGNAVEAFSFYRSGAGENLVEYKLEGFENRGNIVIDGGAVFATSQSAGNGLRAEGNITINGGTVDVTGADQAVWTERQLLITGGEVALNGKHITRAAVAANGFSITGGTVEISSLRAAFGENAVPSMVGHKGYSAVGGITLAEAGVFVREQATKYRYFKLTDGNTVDAPEETTGPTEETTEATEETTVATEETTEVTEETTEVTEETTEVTEETTEVTEETTVVTEETTEVTEETTEVTEQTTETTEQTIGETEPLNEKDTDKKSSIKLILAGILLVVLVGAEVAVLLVLKNRRKDPEIKEGE